MNEDGKVCRKDQNEICELENGCVQILVDRWKMRETAKG